MIGFFDKGKERTVGWNLFFGSHAVDPRKIAPPVEGIGKKNLSRLLSIFSPPMKGEQKKIYVLYSSSAGSGKSHLVGRLFQYFSQKFFLVSLPPLFDSRGFFQYFQECLYSELLFPEKAGATGCWPGQATQLDALAYGLLLELVSRAAQKNKSLFRKIRSALAFLKKNPTSLLPEEVVPEWVEWLKRDFLFVLPYLEKEISGWGTLAEDPRDWIKIIYGFSILGQDKRITGMCKNWFFGEPFSSPDPSFFDIPCKTVPGDREQLAKTKIRDFFKLASRIRPFLIVFDHWEKALIDSLSFDRWAENLLELSSLPGTLTLSVGSDQLWNRLRANPRLSPLLHPFYVEEPKKEDLEELANSRLNKIKGLHKEKKAELTKLIHSYDGPLSFSAFLRYGYERILPLLKDPRSSLLSYFEATFVEMKLALELNPGLLPFRSPLSWFLTHAVGSLSWINVERIEQSPYFCVRWKVGLQRYVLSVDPPSGALTEDSFSARNPSSSKGTAVKEECFLYLLPPLDHPSYRQPKSLREDSGADFLYIDREKYNEIASLYLLFITTYPDLLEQPAVKEKIEALAHLFMTRPKRQQQPPSSSEVPQTYYEIVRDTVKDKKSVSYSSLSASLPVRLPQKDLLRAAGFSPEILVVPSLSGEPHFLWTE